MAGFPPLTSSSSLNSTSEVRNANTNAMWPGFVPGPRRPESAARPNPTNKPVPASVSALASRFGGFQSAAGALLGVYSGRLVGTDSAGLYSSDLGE